MTTYTRARPIAGALTIALGALGILVGGAAGAQAAPATVDGGALDWGLKESFRGYLGGPIAHGTITPADGATRNADGTFRFPAAAGTVDADADTAELAFDGTVAFAGHDSGAGPLLAMSIEDIRIRFDGSGGTLVADVVSKSLADDGEVNYDDVVFASLADADLTGTGTVSATGVAATLTEAGAPAFASFYDAGTALDPVSFAVTTAPQATWDPAITPSRTTGIDPAGETITVTGAGFDPAANVGARPPLAGRETGVYLVFAKLDDPWRPSAGAPSTARTVLDQKWVLPADSRATLDPAGTNPDFAELRADGTFSATLDVVEVTEGKADCAVDTCGVITYAAGGPVNATQELFVPLSFGTAPTEPTVPTDPTVPTEPSDPTTPVDPPADGAVTDARLEWGVKESFRDYVQGPIAHGGWSQSGVSGDGPFRWEDLTSGEFDPSVPEGLLDFAGSVRFTGHDQGAGPLLDLTVSQPQVRVADGTAELLLDVRSKGLEDASFTELDDAVFATLDLASVTPAVAGGVVTFSNVPATLTKQGADGFADFYEAGAELDPVTFAIALDGATLPPAATPPPGQGSGGPAPQGAPVPTSNLAFTGTEALPITIGGAALVLLGAGLLLIRRKRTA